MTSDRTPSPLPSVTPLQDRATGTGWQVCSTILVVALLGAALLAQQWRWEHRAALIVADHHYLAFLTMAADTRDWLAGQHGQPRPPGSYLANPHTPEARSIFPPTRHYPPVVFLLAGLALLKGGVTVAVARLSQWILGAAFLACMARVGWQLAGRRGAILLALGAGTAPWTVYFLYNFTMVPGQLLALSLTMTLLLDSQDLTRPRACAAVGLALGLGMLVKHSFLLYSFPLMVAAAVHGARGSRGAWRGALALSATLAALALFILSVPRMMPESTAEQAVLTLMPVLVAVPQLLFFGLLAFSIRTGRRRGWDSGSGLALAVAVAGMLCSPWYMAHLDLLLKFSGGQWSYSPVSQGVYAPWEIWYQDLWTLNLFYPGGLLWLLGTLALLRWPAVQTRMVPILGAFVGSLSIYVVLLPPSPRYMAPILPAVLVLAFLWAARWKWTFLAVVGLQFLIGGLQQPWLLPTRGLLWPSPPTLEDFNPSAQELILFHIVPPPTVPGATVDPLRPPVDGSTLALRLPGTSHDDGLRPFLYQFLRHRLVLLNCDKGYPQSLQGVDYVLAPPDDPQTLGNRLLKPVDGAQARFRISAEHFRLQLYRVLSPRGDSCRFKDESLKCGGVVRLAGATAPGRRGAGFRGGWPCTARSRHLLAGSGLPGPGPAGPRLSGLPSTGPAPGPGTGGPADRRPAGPVGSSGPHF